MRAQGTILAGRREGVEGPDGALTEQDGQREDSPMPTHARSLHT